MCGGGGIPIISDIGDFVTGIFTSDQPNSPAPVASATTSETANTQGDASGSPQTVPSMISSLASGATPTGSFENLSTMNLGSGYVPEDTWSKIIEILRGNQSA